MRTCLFCETAANSLEDAWPLWIVERFRRDAPATANLQRLGRPTKTWSKQRPELAVRCVCKPCNNGWMSDLENAVKAVLLPMIEGHAAQLPLSAQGLLTVWAVKTAMVLEAIDPIDMRAYRPAECASLRNLKSMPYRTSVWLAKSIDPNCLFSAETRHLAGDLTHAITGASTTIGFGHFVAQVFTIRVPGSVRAANAVSARARSGPWDEVTRQIWPTRASVSWPSAMVLNGELGLNALADRFSVSDMPEADTVALAV